MKHRLPYLIVIILALASPAFAQRLELPVEGLESRVDFWKKVFTQYGKDDIVIHDRIRVNLIYDAADESNVNSKLSDVEHGLKEIARNLESPEALSLPAKQFRDAIIADGLTPSAAVIDDLLENIHTQRGIKERFRDGVIRSGRYVSSFQKIMEGEGVIPELALLPLVESSFQNAKSKAAALGVWQFTRSTGRLYMRVNGKTDERLDPLKSTRAAAKLLRDNYRALGSWPLAITAYNHGRAGMQRAKDEVGPDISQIINEYRGPVFGYASMNFYTEFLAAVDVYNHYEEHFGALALDKPAPGTVVTPKSTVIKTAAIRTPSRTPARSKTATSQVASKYKVRTGDTLYEIAQRFGTSIRELMDKNNLTKPAIYVGQMLFVK